jgi:hypothetical protein
MIPDKSGGFSHSEISGSKFIHNSPELIAVYYVLHRLPAPRHPPNALIFLLLNLRLYDAYRVNFCTFTVSTYEINRGLCISVLFFINFLNS